MLRTTIQMTQEQYKALQALSKDSNQSIARIIRQAIDQFLVSRKPDKTALYRLSEPAIGKFSSGQRDISEKHDQYLEETFGS